ncbi:MAG: protein kinase [Isosphaeraceae bacterium]
MFKLTLDLTGPSQRDRARGRGAELPGPEEIQPYFSDLEILEVVGAGGMGVVYKARQTGLGRLVAVKVLAPERAADPEFSERFLREAASQARLNHPNIVAVHDIGTTSGLTYLVMEYVEGKSLRSRLRAGEIGPSEGLRIIPQICEAIQYAHDRGVIHRDIKPENVLVDLYGNAKIADFGLAKFEGGDSYRLTETNERLGTAQYMAPEQWRHSASVDHRADIYALGVLFYELLTGECPTPRYNPPSLKAGTDPRLDGVIARSLDSDPGRRYQKASELKSDVERIARTSHVPWARRAAAVAILATLAVLIWPAWRAAPRPVNPPTVAAAPDPWEWSTPENLGPQVNSESDDGGPAISADGLTLLFHSRRPGGLGETDLWECRRTSPGAPFGPARNLGAPMNSAEHDGEPTLSADGLTLVFVSHRGGGNASSLWASRRASLHGVWEAPVELGPQVNSGPSQQRPSLLSDGRTIVFTRGGNPTSLFTARRPSATEEFGEPAPLDLQIGESPVALASFTPDGLTVVFDRRTPGDQLWAASRSSFDEPFRTFRSFGPAVNSPSVDTSPTLSVDGRTLYFCSMRPGGQGHYDLWQSRRVVTGPGAVDLRSRREGKAPANPSSPAAN